MTNRQQSEEGQVQAEALRLIKEELEAVSFDIDSNTRQTQISFERHVELVTRRKGLIKLLKMHGGSPAEYAPERIAQ